MSIEISLETAPAPIPPAPDAPHAGDGAPAACPNCAADRLGAFCHGCGQHHLDGPITFRTLWRELVERFFKLERGLPLTVKALTLAPGVVARDYVEGRRRRYVNPLSYLLIGVGLSLLVLPLLWSSQFDGASSGAQVEEMLEMGKSMGARMAGTDIESLPPEKRARLEAFTERYMTEFMPVYLQNMMETMQRLYSLLAVAFAAVLAVFFRLFLGGTGPRRTLAETFVPTLYLTGHYYLLFGLFTVAAVVLSLGMWTTTVVATGLLLALTVWTAVGFYDRSWGTAAMAALAFVASYVVYLVVVLVTTVPVAMWLSRHAYPTV